ncbi:unnamed protein product [Caenorhabditis nigoni]
MKNLIESSQTKRFKSIKRIMGEFDNTGEVIIPPISNNDYIMKTFEELEEDDKNDYFQLNLSGRIVDFLLPEHHDVPVPTATYHTRDKASVIESICKYCLDFFGAHLYYFWTTIEGKRFCSPNFDTIFDDSSSD